MSRSNPTQSVRNPSKRWYEWHGLKGCIQFYDKNKKDKESGELGTNVLVPLPFAFVYLDSLSSVTGYNKPSQSNIYSNEVRDTRNDQFEVRLHGRGGQTLAVGFYADIKERVKGMGGKFTKSIYLAYKEADGTLSIGVLLLKGAALGAWSDFQDANHEKIERGNYAVKITGSEDGENGGVRFKIPVFALIEVSPESGAAAAELDGKLQSFLSGYLTRSAATHPAGRVAHGDEGQDHIHDDPPASEVPSSGDGEGVFHDSEEAPHGGW